MNTYRCPNCKKVFSQEEMDAVFCPHCPTTLCECVMRKEREDVRSFSPRAAEWIRTLFCCGVLTWIFARLLLPFWLRGTEPDAAGLLLLGPVWCGVSAPLFRLLARGEYSVRTGILGAGMWLFTFLVWRLPDCCNGRRCSGLFRGDISRSVSERKRTGSAICFRRGKSSNHCAEYRKNGFIRLIIPVSGIYYKIFG